jgi:hypothetical protein
MHEIGKGIVIVVRLIDARRTGVSMSRAMTKSLLEPGRGFAYIDIYVNSARPSNILFLNWAILQNVGML